MSAKSVELGSDIRVWYRIGTIDPRHDISENEVREIARKAERMWEDAIRRNLIHFSGKSDFKINVLWGPLSEWNQKRAEAYRTLHRLYLRVDAAERRWAEAYERVEQSEKAYEMALAAHRRDLEQHNREVSKWNRDGGAPPNVYRNLIDEADRLDSRSEALEARRLAFNQEVAAVNALKETYDERFGDHERAVAYFREQFPEKVKMDQGLYYTEGIDIYYFEDEDDLRITIAHELGHALGIGHTDDPATLMYPLKSKTNEHLKIITEVDLGYLREALQRPPDFARIWREHQGGGSRFQVEAVGPDPGGMNSTTGHFNCCQPQDSHEQP